MKKMGKLMGVLLAGMVAVSLLAGCGGGAAPEKRTIKVGIGLNEQSPQYKGLEKFKEIVERDSKGRIEVQLFASSQLGDDTKMMTALRAGTLEMTCPSTAPISGLDKKWMVFDLPFLFPNEEVADKVLDGPVGQKYLDSLSTQGIKGIAFWENGYRQLTNSKVNVKTPADVKGLKIRTMENPVHLATFRTLGANPTPMPLGELFTSMQQHIVDGQENPLTTIYLQKYYEVQKYTSVTNHFYSPFVFMFSQKIWNTLPKEDQELIARAGKEAGIYQRKTNREMMQEASASLEKAGMVVTRLTPEQAQAFVDATKDIAGQFEAEIGKDNVQEVKAEIAKYSQK
ncbi:TRAP transporter substrate-binding protein [Acetonema longum]|uniref:C4-dicarboxylate transport system C4-dicarboxylate-binding protein n=1 Tax=Acetonema longum DSM 6540 TaxID=1009370 RepID=F7NMM9_9FIRM|nr:TRAP transporter substrate-binding protein [Acetonema longum]EGO62693.1 C4-dicarboxylate transport system C4-dicarboxylate-binding protein [Acetonema longum DSM 6540]